MYLCYDNSACNKKQLLCCFLITSQIIAIFHWVDQPSAWLDQWHPVASRWCVYSEWLLTNTVWLHSKCNICFVEKSKTKSFPLLKLIQSAMMWRLKNSLWHCVCSRHQRDICSITAQSVSRSFVRNFITFPFCLPQSPPVLLSFISFVFLLYLKPKPTVACLKSNCHDLQLPWWFIQ